MIFKKEVYDLMLFIGIAIPIVIFVIRKYKIVGEFFDDSDKSVLGILIFTILPIFNILISYFAFQSNKVIFLSIFVATLLLLILSVYQYENELVPLLETKDSDFDVFQMLLLTIIPLLITGLSFQKLTSKTYEVNSEHSESIVGIDVDLLKKSFKKISDKYEEIDLAISSETENIKREIELTLKKVEEKNEEIKLLKKRESDLISQVKYYKNLSSLTKEQSDAVVQALERNKSFDYLIGGVVGFIASFFVALIADPKLLRRIFKTASSK